MLEAAGWLWVNQDRLGSREECTKQMTKGLKKGTSVVLDRVNPQKKERKMWTREAKLAAPDVILEAAFLNTDVEVCRERCQTRKNHPTLGPEMANEIIDDFSRQMQPPQTFEGFVTVHDLHFGTLSDARAWVSSLRAHP